MLILSILVFSFGCDRTSNTPESLISYEINKLYFDLSDEASDNTVLVKFCYDRISLLKAKLPSEKKEICDRVCEKLAAHLGTITVQEIRSSYDMKSSKKCYEENLVNLKKDLLVAAQILSEK